MMTPKINCPECGAENAEDAEFCHACRASLTDDATSAFIDPEQSDQDNIELLQGDQDDLPGLLHALKQEGEAGTEGDETQESDISSIEQESFFEQESDQEDEGVPDWLNRIRERASKEDDSVGEITQKISAAKESLFDDKSSSQHENFETWIQRLRGPIGGEEDGESYQAEITDDVEEEAEEIKQDEPEWLKKIRKAEGKQGIEDDHQTLDHGENSLLNWLVTLEDGEEGAGEVEEEPSDEEGERLDEKATEEEIDDFGVTQEVLIDDDLSPDIIPPKLSVNEKEQNQADQLTSLIMDEGAPRPVRKLVRRSSLGAARFFFAILLILSLTLTLYIGGSSVEQTGLIQPHTAGFLTWAKETPENGSLLLVFDYQPAYSSEINLITAPILNELAERDVRISVISSSMSGPFLYRHLFDDISGLDLASVVDLGYFPTGAYAAFGLGMDLSANWRIVGLPGSAKALPSDGFDGILILSDTYEGAKTWIEQLSILMPETPLNLILTAQSLPLLVPYFDSGQVTGIISGLNGGVILENELSGGNQIGVRWQAYQAGLLMLMAVIVIGAIYAGYQKQEEGGVS